MGRDMVIGFTERGVVYKRSVCDNWSVYEEKRDDGKCFRLYRQNGRNGNAIVTCGNIRLSSRGTTGRNHKLVTTWSLDFLDEATGNELPCFICKTERDIIAMGNTIREEIEQENDDLLVGKKEEILKKAKAILDDEIRKNLQFYEKIKDKSSFEEQMIEHIVALIEDEMADEWNFADEFFWFQKSEAELPTFLKNLNVESVLKVCTSLKDQAVDFEDLCVIIEEVINEIKTEGVAPLICDYRETIFSDIEMCVEESVKEREKEKVRVKYSKAVLMSLFEDKISCVTDKKHLEEKIERELLNGFWESEDSLLQRVKENIEWTLQSEQTMRKIEELQKYWGSDEKIVELTPDKKIIFNRIEDGEILDEYSMREFELYQELLAEYTQMVYRKGGKSLKPTFAAIPAYMDLFDNVVRIAKNTGIVDEMGNFVGFDGIGGFKKQFAKYEKGL